MFHSLCIYHFVTIDLTRQTKKRNYLLQLKKVTVEIEESTSSNKLVAWQ
jgi:hypothetical protein